jgi:exonuclease VII small subunit
MDPKTKKTLEGAERRVRNDLQEDVNGVRNPARPAGLTCIVDVLILCDGVRELDKIARHASEERDAFGKRIDKLEAEIATMKERERVRLEASLPVR